MRGVLIRMGVLAVLGALIPLVLVGLAAWKNPHTIEGPAQAALLSLVLVVCVHVGWALRDGYHRWCGWRGPLAWLAVCAVSPLGLFVLAGLSVGDLDDPQEGVLGYAALAGIGAALTVSGWLVGRAMPEGSFDVQDEPVV